MKKIFREFELTWIKLIIFAILAGVYTAIMAILPMAKDTSFADITITMEVWILFGIFINSGTLWSAEKNVPKSIL